MDSHKILSLLGLALRGNHLAVGEEPVEAAARAKDARLLLLASDVADNTRRRTVHFSEPMPVAAAPLHQGGAGKSGGPNLGRPCSGDGYRPCKRSGKPFGAVG